MRLIDADALDMYESLKSYYGDAWRDAQKEIDNAPTVDAEPVRHAILVNASPYGECSCCGELIDSRDRFRYCPYCGAKLDGEKHGSD